MIAQSKSLNPILKTNELVGLDPNLKPSTNRIDFGLDQSHVIMGNLIGPNEEENLFQN